MNRYKSKSKKKNEKQEEAAGEKPKVNWRVALEKKKKKS